MTENPVPLLPVADLARRLADPAWRVFDCRHDLRNVEYGAQAWAKGHIPGALHLHLDRDLSGPTTGRNGRHPLPDKAGFAARLGQLGVTAATRVVAYDNEGGIFASRLWWMLRWLGHEHAYVLDGGLAAWKQAKLPLDAAVPVVAPAAYAAGQGPAPVLVEEVLAKLGDPATLIPDARAEDRFRGENETLDPVGGHIPGAMNRFYFDNLDDAGHAPGQVIQQCGSDVTACHNHAGHGGGGAVRLPTLRGLLERVVRRSGATGGEGEQLKFRHFSETMQTPPAVGFGNANRVDSWRVMLPFPGIWRDSRFLPLPFEADRCLPES